MDRPGNVRVVIEGRRDIHAKLFAWHNKNSRPDLERPAWGGLEMTVVDPVNNRIAFVASERQA